MTPIRCSASRHQAPGDGGYASAQACISEGGVFRLETLTLLALKPKVMPSLTYYNPTCALNLDS